MALASTIVWEVRSTGAQTNGGGFKTGATGTDFSQQAAAQYVLTSAVSTVATAVITHASAAADMVGNTCRVVSGTNATLGWYEITSVSVGVSLTVDRNWCTGAVSNGAVNVGGAFLIGGTLDDDFFDAHVAGNTVYIASTTGGVTYTLGEAVNAIGAGTGLLPVSFIGYKDTRATVPTGADRPTIAQVGYALALNSYREINHIIFTITGLQHGPSTSGNCYFFNCKFSNSSATTNRYGMSMSTNDKLIRCEIICTNGYAVYYSGSSPLLNFCYIHDSVVGIQVAQAALAVINCIIDTCSTNGIALNGYDNCSIINNTIYNCGTGITDGAGNSISCIFINNIITGCTTGASWTAEVPNNFWDYNCWNNTTDVSNVTKGSNDITSDPLLNNPAAGDFTLAVGSPCFDAGMQPGAEIGL